MEIQCPKNGFVVKLLVVDGKPVSAGTAIVQLETYEEDRDLADAKSKELMRLIQGRKYDDSQVKNKLRLAQIAIDIAQKNVEIKERIHNRLAAERQIGTTLEERELNAQSELLKAKLEYEKATEQLDQLKHTIADGRDMNENAKNRIAEEIRWIYGRIERMKVLAPISGTVTFLAAPNSFLEIGDSLAKIE
jgi:multidrug resistance efflux pump